MKHCPSAKTQKRGVLTFYFAPYSRSRREKNISTLTFPPCNTQTNRQARCQVGPTKLTPTAHGSDEEVVWCDKCGASFGPQQEPASSHLFQNTCCAKFIWCSNSLFIPMVRKIEIVTSEKPFLPNAC